MSKFANAETLYELGARPIDRIAWRVIQPGEHWETKDRVELLIFDAPPEPPDTAVIYNNDTQRPADYTGTRFGRLTVWYYWRRKERIKVRENNRGQSGQAWARENYAGRKFDPKKARTLRLERASGASNHEWLCRCGCGLFVVRSASAIKRGLEGPYRTPPSASYIEIIMCSHCFALEKLRGNVPEYYRQ